MVYILLFAVMVGAGFLVGLHNHRSGHGIARLRKLYGYLALGALATYLGIAALNYVGMAFGWHLGDGISGPTALIASAALLGMGGMGLLAGYAFAIIRQALHERSWARMKDFLQR